MKMKPNPTPQTLIKTLFSTVVLTAFTLLLGNVTSQAQTSPAEQTLPYTQNFGTATFTTMPAGTAAWNGLSGGTVTSQAAAEASAPTGDAAVTAKTTSQTTGGAYSYLPASSSNVRFYIQTSSNAGQGADQLAITFNSGASTAVTIAYTIEVVNVGGSGSSIGSVLQYRAGTSGAWTTVPTAVNVFANGSVTAGAITSYSYTLSGLTASSTYQLRWAHWRSAGTSMGIAYDDIAITGAGASVALDNTGTPAIGSIIAGTSDVPVFGFQLTPTGGSVNFTALRLTNSSTATTSDLSNFRVVYDADNSGTFNAGDTVVSSAPQSLANPLNFTITGQTGFSAARRYLVLANVAAGATVGHTFTGILTTATNVTTTGIMTGGASGNQLTIAAAVYDLTMSAVGGSESTSISSLTNDATITSTAAAVQTWQVMFNNPAGSAGAANISAITFIQGANNAVTNWATTIQAAELFDGNTPLAAGVISATGITFSGLSVNVADNNSKTLSLRISLKSTAGVLRDNIGFQFDLEAGNVTVTGNGVTTPSIFSDQNANVITVVGTKLGFTSVPSAVITNVPFSSSIQAQDANGNRDYDNNSTVTVTLASGSGALNGTAQVALLNGTNRVSLSYNTVETFSLLASDDGAVLAPGTSTPILGKLAPGLAEVVMPLYMEGIATGNSNTKRVPYAFCVTLSNLTTNSVYRYYNQCVSAGDTLVSSGAGNVIFASASGAFGRSTGPTFSSAGNYGTFTSDASGNYTGWFISEATGNVRFLTAGTAVFMRIFLNDGADGTGINYRLTTPDSAAVLPFGTDGTSGTGIYGSSSATDKNFVLLYDNVAGTGRPLVATFVENDGQAENTSASFVKFYNDSVDGVSGAWGNIIPNTNPNGVQRIEQRSLAGGGVVFANTDADGIWPSGANTVNPAGGDATPVVITSADAPLSASAPTTPVITAIQVNTGNVLIDFTGGAADVTGSFTILSTANLTNALAPISATVTTSGPGVFRASIPMVTPAAFYRIKR